MTPDWRTRHCADLAIEAASKATGRDIWRELGGRPGSNREAADLYRRNGATMLGDLVTKVLGQPIDPAQAGLGDICMVDGALGIVRGPGAVECIDGYQRIERATAAWRVTGG